MADCQVAVPPIPGLDESTLTVGRIFEIHCKGNFSGEKLEGDGTRVLAEKEDPYSLKIFKTEFPSADEVKITATSYRPGPQKIENLKIKWGEKTMELGSVQFEVQTVIEQRPDQQQVEPFGPMALALNWPLLLWVVGGLLILFAVLFFGFRFRRSLQRKALIEELRQHDSAQTPLAEVHQTYRRWRREHSFFYGHSASQEELKKFLGEVEASFRLYLTRVFKVPALKWNEKLILKDLRKYHRAIYDQFQIELRRFFLELSKAQEAKALQSQDMIQLSEGLRILAEKITQAQTSGGKR